MKKPVAKRTGTSLETRESGDYAKVLAGVTELLEGARRASARVVNSLMTATYWEIGRRIVEQEQAGQRRADYGTELIQHLSKGLTKLFGRIWCRPTFGNAAVFPQFLQRRNSSISD